MAFKEKMEDVSHSYICMSCDHQQCSRLVSIEGESFRSIEIPHFNPSAPTILIQAVADDQWVQVNPSEIRLIHKRDKQLTVWKPPCQASRSRIGF